MFAHIAQSIGGALPGGGGGDAFISQILVQEQILGGTAPPGSAFAFVEILTQGGYHGAAEGAGGTGADLITPLSAGASFNFSINYSRTAQAQTRFQLGGAILISLLSPGLSNADQQPSPGKYPGQASSGGSPGKGGGRLAGPRPSQAGDASSFGSGGIGGQPATVAGRGAGCITFFRNREAAVAFANSLYNGAWVPS